MIDTFALVIIQGMFYGLTQSSLIQDITASIISSLVGTLPVKVVRILFEKSKPRIERSTLSTSDGTVITTDVITLADGQQAHLHREESGTHSEDIGHGTAGDTAGDGAGGEMNGTEIKGGGQEDDGKTDEERENERKKEVKEMILEGEVTIAEFSQRLVELYPGETKEYRLRAIRQVVFEDMYPLPHWARYVGWVFCLFFTIAGCFFAIWFGLAFDLDYDSEDDADYLDDDCWWYDLEQFWENELSEDWFDALSLEYLAETAESWAGSDTDSWLLALASSLSQSLFIWQPLSAYIISW